MRGDRVSGRELTDLRGLLARLTFETKLLRFERHLARKDWSDQPRAPAGQSEGGQWISGAGGPSQEDPVTTGSVATEDGSRVLSFRVRANRRPFDEQHIVTAPDGESRIFETLGDTQTIRDGATGEVLSRSTFTGSWAEPEARVQPAFLPVVPAIIGTVAQIARTLELAFTLLTILSARKDGFGPVFRMTAREYGPVTDERNLSDAWIRTLTAEELNGICPRNVQVLEMTNRNVEYVKKAYPSASPLVFGNAVHLAIAREVKRLDDPNFVAELLLSGLDARRPGRTPSVRLDLLERTPSGAVCVYDHKTGGAGLDPTRALDLAIVGRRH